MHIVIVGADANAIINESSFSLLVDVFGNDKVR